MVRVSLYPSVHFSLAVLRTAFELPWAGLLSHEALYSRIIEACPFGLHGWCKLLYLVFFCSFALSFGRGFVVAVVSARLIFLRFLLLAITRGRLLFSLLLSSSKLRFESFSASFSMKLAVSVVIFGVAKFPIDVRR